jgi:hypothetical protein
VRATMIMLLTLPFNHELRFLCIGKDPMAYHLCLIIRWFYLTCQPTSGREFRDKEGRIGLKSRQLYAAAGGSWRWFFREVHKMANLRYFSNRGREAVPNNWRMNIDSLGWLSPKSDAVYEPAVKPIEKRRLVQIRGSLLMGACTHHNEE